MKTRRIIGAIIAIIGVGVAIMTPDDCQNEITLRFAGIAAFAIGAYLAEAFDFQTKKGDAK